MFAQLLLLVVCAEPSPPAPVLVVSDGGYALLTQDATGKSSLVPISQVVVLGKPSPIPTPGPGPGPNPTPTPSTGFGLDPVVRQLVIDMSGTAKADLPNVARVISQAATSAIAGKFNTLAEVEAVTNQLIVSQIRDKDGWLEFATTVDAALVDLQAKGKIATPQDYGRALAEIAGGMSPSPSATPSAIFSGLRK